MNKATKVTQFALQPSILGTQSIQINPTKSIDEFSHFQSHERPLVSKFLLTETPYIQSIDSDLSIWTLFWEKKGTLSGMSLNSRPEGANSYGVPGDAAGARVDQLKTPSAVGNLTPKLHLSSAVPVMFFTSSVTMTPK